MRLLPLMTDDEMLAVRVSLYVDELDAVDDAAVCAAGNTVVVL